MYNFINPEDSPHEALEQTACVVETLSQLIGGRLGEISLNDEACSGFTTILDAVKGVMVDASEAFVAETRENKERFPAFASNLPMEAYNSESLCDAWRAGYKAALVATEGQTSLEQAQEEMGKLDNETDGGDDESYPIVNGKPKAETPTKNNKKKTGKSTKAA